MIILDDRLIERFWSKVDKTETCWVWTNHLNWCGYGAFRIGDKKHGAHRVSYVIDRGEQIPEGFQIDHLCKNRACVRPSHLEVVTLQENVRRGNKGGTGRFKTHCVKGHPLVEGNLYHYQKNGRPARRCRECDLMRHR